MTQYGIVEPDVVYGVAGKIKLKKDIYYPSDMEVKYRL